VLLGFMADLCRAHPRPPSAAARPAPSVDRQTAPKFQPMSHLGTVKPIGYKPQQLPPPDHNIYRQQQLQLPPGLFAPFHWFEQGSSFTVNSEGWPKPKP
jgi:hypothetical protein